MNGRGRPGKAGLLAPLPPPFRNSKLPGIKLVGKRGVPTGCAWRPPACLVWLGPAMLRRISYVNRAEAQRVGYTGQWGERGVLATSPNFCVFSRVPINNDYLAGYFRSSALMITHLRLFFRGFRGSWYVPEASWCSRISISRVFWQE